MYSSDRNQPARELLTEGVIIPLLQALTTGAFSGLAGLALSFWLALPFWQMGFTGFALAALASWLSYRGRWQGMIEHLFGMDLNGDGAIGEPPVIIEPAREPEKIRVEVVSEEGRRGDFIDLPYPDKLPLLASGLLQEGRQFTQSVWTGGGALFSRSEFENLRGELIRRGLARWKNENAPAQGAVLTAAGRAVFRRLASLPPPPLVGE